MKSRVLNALVIVGTLTLTELLLHGLAAPVCVAVESGQRSLSMKSDVAQAEQAVLAGVLGGFRAAVADFFWLQASGAAEEQDLPATAAWLRTVTVIDPRPLYFWLNRARMTAYDMTVWRIESAGGDERVPAAMQARFAHEQAQEALELLDEAGSFHPASAALWIERANLELNRLGDTAAAAESYRRASEQPDAPFYAARLHAELLRRLGRKAEALAWLRRLHPNLPADDEAAAGDLVLARIRVLEGELDIPDAAKYRPQ